MAASTERARRVSRKGVSLAVREWPARRRGVLLLHGLASTSHIFDRLVPFLRPAFHIAAPDQRGHGESDKPAGGYAMAEVAADAARVARAAGLRRPVVVGHSWGANVALQLAHDHPGVASALVLVDGGFGQMRDAMDWPTARARLAPPRLAGMRVESLIAGVRADGSWGRMWSEEIEAVLLSLFEVRAGRIRPRLSRANHLRILRSMWEQPTAELLAGVRIPTLVLAARPPDPSPGEAAFYAVKRVAAARVRRIGPPVRFEWITGIHDVPLQRPRELAARIVALGASTR